MIRPRSLFALLVAPVWLIAQSPPTPPALTRLEAGTCPRCTLKLEYVATVGRADDKELIKDGSNMTALRSGGFLVWGDGLMQLYDAKGKYLRTIGRLGEGPGEYKGANAVVEARGDSVLIYAYGRMTTISLATGKGRTAQSLTEQRAFRALSLPNGDVLAQNYNGRPGVFIVLAPDGTVRKAFGGIGDSVVQTGGGKAVSPDARQWGIAPAAAGGFWAAKLNYKFALERWSLNGRVQQVIGEGPEWFAPHTFEARSVSDRQGVGKARFLPRVLGLWSDAREQLFLLGVTADRAWKRDPDATAGASFEPTGGLSRYVDAIIAAYDGKRGAYLGSWRTDEWIDRSIGNGLVAIRKQSEDGVLSYQLWRVVLSGR